jgi:hypothetical protein
MATWQAHFEIIADGEIPPSLISEYDALLPRYPSWSEDILAWGSDDGNRIHLLVEGGRPVESSFRVDCRTSDESFVLSLLALLRQHGMRVQTEQGDIIEPELNLFANVLEGSRAFRFAVNPHLYLRRLRIGGLDDA